jgi:hypothetical protein
VLVERSEVLFFVDQRKAPGLNCQPRPPATQLSKNRRSHSHPRASFGAEAYLPRKIAEDRFAHGHPPHTFDKALFLLELYGGGPLSGWPPADSVFPVGKPIEPGPSRSALNSTCRGSSRSMRVEAKESLEPASTTPYHGALGKRQSDTI